MHRLWIIAVVLLSNASESTAAVETQTEWLQSGSYGPTSNWGSGYYVDEKLAHSTNLHLRFGALNPIDSELPGARRAAAGDFNGDGCNDVVAEASGILLWYCNNGSGSIWEPVVIDQWKSCITDLTVGDINGSGHSDVIRCSVDGQMEWYENVDGTGNIWEKHTVENAPGTSYTSIELADIDIDGEIDILFSDGTNGLYWMENLDGTGLIWEPRCISNTIGSTCSIHAVDLDGDGMTDIISGRDEFVIDCFRGLDTAGLSWEYQDLIQGSFPPRDIDFGYIDGDTHPDIFSACYLYGGFQRLSWFENPGYFGPFWEEHIIQDDFIWCHELHATDFDSDGFADIAASTNYQVCFFENVSWGNSWLYMHLEDCRSLDVSTGDFNDDGYQDLIYPDHNEDDLVWVDLTSFNSSGYLESTVLNVSEQPYWESITWSCNEPEETSVGIQLRTSSNFPVMGLWTDTLYEPCSLDTLLEHGDDYIQYRVVLETLNPLETPVFNEISIEWEPLQGINENAGTAAGLQISPNPFSRGLSISVYLPDPSEVSVQVFDLSGRQVSRPFQSCPSSSEHTFFWEPDPSLPEGCFFIRVSTPAGILQQRCVYLR